MTATAPKPTDAAVVNDGVIGFYVLYSIPEQSIQLARARKAFRDNGLDVTRLPEERRPEHVMQDACTNAQRITQNGHREEVRAQRVGRDGDFLIYQLTTHRQDLANRIIEHPQALRVLFNFADDSLIFEPLDGASMADVQGLVDEIRDYFDAHRAQMPGRGLRTVLRHYIEAAGAEMIREGAYFLHRAMRLPSSSKLRIHHGEVIEGARFIACIQGALRDIYDTEPEFHPIPCRLSDPGQREFLKRKFIENASEDLKSYRNECLGLVAGKNDRQRAFRTDKRARMVERRREIEARRRKFSELLNEPLDELNVDMALADKALAQFLREADA